VRDRVLADWKAEEAHKVAEQSASGLLAAAREKKSLEEAVREKKIEVKTSEWFSRKNPDKALQALGIGVEQMFRLVESAPFTDPPLAAGNKFVVCQFLGKKAADAEVLEKEMPALGKRLLEEKQEEVWEAWMADIRGKTRVEIIHAP
jgi:predicted HTH transcriptional regulator